MTPKGPSLTLQPFLKVVPTSPCILIPNLWVPSMFHVLWDPKNTLQVYEPITLLLLRRVHNLTARRRFLLC